MLPFTPAEREVIAVALADLFLGVDADELDEIGRQRLSAAQSALSKLPPIAQTV